MDGQRASSRLSLCDYPQSRCPQPLRHCSIVFRGKSRREESGRGRNDVTWARESHLGRATTFLIAESFTSPGHYASRETPTPTRVIVMWTFVASLPPDHQKKKKRECRMRYVRFPSRPHPVFRRLIIHRRGGTKISIARSRRGSYYFSELRSKRRSLDN